MSLVLDASAALAWMFVRVKRAEAQRADRLLETLADQAVLVPVIWHNEVCNALLVAERRKLTSEAQTTDFLERLSRLPIDTDPTPIAPRREMLVAIGRRFGLSAYDASYLDLALRTGATLASFDTKLLAAMRKAGGETYQ